MRSLAAVVSLALAACSSGIERTTIETDARPAVGDGMRISELIGPGSSPLPTYPNSYDAYVTGVVVTTIDRFDETADGKGAGNLYVQDALFDRATSPGWHGITVYQPSFSPPNLRVTPGDVLDFRGGAQAFTGPASFPFPPGQVLPELAQSVGSFRFETAVPEPIDVAADDLLSYDKGGRYIGMLVRVRDVTVTGSTAPNPRYRLGTTVGGAPGPTLTNELFPLDTAPEPNAAGARFSSVVGIVTYFQTPSLAPRSADDFVK